MLYNSENGYVELSVRELCALAFRRGSIDNRVPPPWLHHSAREGQETRERLRALREEGRGLGGGGRAMGTLRGSEELLFSGETLPEPGYHTEVALRHTCRMEGVAFSVSGRADGVWYDPAGGCVVEEIRFLPGGQAPFYGGTPREVELAQLTCYAFFLCAAKGLSRVTLRLTYVCPGREEEASSVDSLMTAEGLAQAYGGILRRVLPRAKVLLERETVLRGIARRAIFPYDEIRGAQQDMIRECWRDMRAGKTLFAEAPTGLGKTMATLYPAVRCFGEGRFDKIFYLTAKNATRREAFAAVQKLNEAMTPIRACVITARENACICEAVREGGGRVSSFCNPMACPYARGYYDRVEGVLFDLLKGERTVFSGLDIRAAAKEGQVCPYELALDLSELCEIVICDYNYLFSPAVSLRRYFAEGIPHTSGHRYAFLVDEAHNLPDRARDMYSASLSLAQVLAVQETMHAWETGEEGRLLFPVEDGGVEEDRTAPRLRASALDDLIGALSRMSRACAESMVRDEEGVCHGVNLDRNQPVVLCETVRNLSALCDRWLRRSPSHPLYLTVEELATTLRGFRTAADYYDRSFATLVEVEGEDVRVGLICLDPAALLRPILKKAETGVLFSATLTPNDYFADILGGDKDSVLVSFSSPFPRDHLCVAVCDEVSTRYEDRDGSCRKIMNYIAATVSAKRGNYMVYFPSYAYLERVYALFQRKYPTVKTVVQRPGMSYGEKETFIRAFTDGQGELLVGFCVLGGSFSEGVDLPGRSLIGTVIVGVGIPALSNQRNVMRDYYDETRDLGEETGGEGYAYAYTYPGMNRILQAAGRVIRRPEDRGVVVLLDDRYAEEPYLHLYPEHWEQISSVSEPTDLYEYLKAFWESAEEA